MDADTQVAFAGVYQRLAALEAGAATVQTNAAAAANAVAVANAQQLAQMQTDQILRAQAQAAAMAAIYHPDFQPHPNWAGPGHPYPIHG